MRESLSEYISQQIIGCFAPNDEKSLGDWSELRFAWIGSKCRPHFISCGSVLITKLNHIICLVLKDLLSFPKYLYVNRYEIAVIFI
jgi:hypothetical protein